MFNRKNNGFTLTELLVSIGTIGVIASLLLPAVTKAKHKARDSQCINNQRNVRSNLESTYSDVVPDYNTRWNGDEASEFKRVFFEEYNKELVPDPTFHYIGAFQSKSLTCPFALNDKKVRVPFGIFTPYDRHKGLHWEKGVNYITYTYDIDFDNFNNRINENKVQWVMDTPNTMKPYTWTFKGNYFANEREDRAVLFGSTQIHPHKGRGAYVTYGNGNHRWVQEREFIGQSVRRAPDNQ